MGDRPAGTRSPSTVPAAPPLGLLPTVALVAAPCILILGAVTALVALTEHPFEYFSRDPASTLVASPFVGLLSHAGVLLTWGAAVTCAFAGVLVARARGWRHASPLLAAAGGAAYLALDDLLLLHDDIFPQKVGIAQEPSSSAIPSWHSCFCGGSARSSGSTTGLCWR